MGMEKTMRKILGSDGMSTPAYRILVADDEEGTRKAIMRALQLSGYAVWGATNGNEVFSILENEQIDLLLLDLRMPEMDGLQVMQQIIQDRSELIVIVLTAHATLESAITAVKAGAFDYLKKPQPIASIKLAIQEALERKTTETRRQQLLQIARETIETLQEGEQKSGKVDPRRKIKSWPNSVFSLLCQQRLLHVQCNGEQHIIELTADQCAILSLLAERPGKVFTAESIAHEALGYPDLDAFESLSIVRPHIQRLRRRLKSSAECAGFIKTVRGSGYLLSRELIRGDGCKDC